MPGDGVQRPLEWLRRSGFARDVAIVASGITAAQAIAVLASPILTRLYAPDDLGIMAIFTAIAGGITIAAAWRYDMAIALPKSEAEAANLLGLSCLIILLMAFLSATILAVVGDWLVRVLGVPELERFLFLVPIAVLAMGLSQPLTWWAARRQQYRQSSLSQIVRSAGSTTAQVVFGLAKSGPGGLILGGIVGQLVGIGLLAVQTWRRDGRLIVASLNRKELLRLGREYDEFPKFNMPRAVLYSLAQTAPPLLLAMYFSAAAAGAYWLADRICQMPIVLLGEAVRQVLYQRAAARYNGGEGLLEILTKSTVGLVLIVAAPFLITILYAPTLFGIAFGDEWTHAGHYCQWLVIPWIFNFICGPSTTLVPVFGHQRLLLLFDGLTWAPRLAVIPLALYFGDDVTAIAMYSVLGAMFHFCILVFVFLRAWRHQLLIRAASVEA